MKASFSRAAFNSVEKTSTWDNASNWPRKTVLLRLLATAQKNFGPSKRIWRFLWLLFDRGFSLVCFPYLRNFDVFGEAKDMEGKGYDKTFLLLRLLWVMLTILQWWRKGKVLLSLIALRRPVRVKKSDLKKKETSPEEVLKHGLSTLGLPLNSATKSNCGGLDKKNLNWKQE